MIIRFLFNKPKGIFSKSCLNWKHFIVDYEDDRFESPAFAENNEPSTGLTNTNNRRYGLAEKTLSVAGSILDMPLPDNDAFSEYSTFVNNIFNK